MSTDTATPVVPMISPMHCMEDKRVLEADNKGPIFVVIAIGSSGQALLQATDGSGCVILENLNYSGRQNLDATHNTISISGNECLDFSIRDSVNYYERSS